MSDTLKASAEPVEGDFSTIDAPFASLSIIEEEPSLLESVNFSSDKSVLREHSYWFRFHLL
jgi:hypothetical protein